MTDHLDSLDDPSEDELAELTALLGRADAWDDPPPELEDAVVAAIAAEADPDADPVADRANAPTSLTEHRNRRAPSMTGLLGAAAAVVVLVAGIVVINRSGDDEGVVFALAGTDAAPGASAEVHMAATPSGLKIELDAEGLPGAPDGFMYEAWVGNGTIAISTGTFHLRGGNGPIELWAGVTDPSFHRLWITLEPIDDDSSPSGDARLSGEFSLAND
jgi:Anti-sigma-K factor rskA, C-terminal